jgi:hypothetical protein
MVGAVSKSLLRETTTPSAAGSNCLNNVGVSFLSAAQGDALKVLVSATPPRLTR